MPKGFKQYIEERNAEGENFAVPVWDDNKIIPPEPVQASAELPVWDDAKILPNADDDDSGLSVSDKAIKLAEGGSFGMTPYASGGLGALGRILGIKGAGNALKDIDYSGLGSEATLNPSKLSEAYDTGYNKEQEVQEGISKKSPIESLLLNLAGGLSTGKMLPNKLLQPLGPATANASKAGQIIHNIKNAAIGGAAMGAALPTESPDILSTDAIKNRAVNAGFGGVFGGALTGAIEGVPAVAGALRDKANKIISGTSFESGMDAGLKGMWFKSDAHTKYLSNLFDEDLKTIGTAVGGVKDARQELVKGRATELKNSIKELTNDIKSLETTRDTNLKAATKNQMEQHNIQLHSAVETEKAKLSAKLEAMKTEASRLILDNSDLFSRTTGFLEDQIAKKVASNTIKKQTNTDFLKEVGPAQFENKLQGIIKDTGANRSGDYRLLDTKLNDLNNRLIGEYRNDLVKFNGELPPELLSKYEALGFNGANVKNMPDSFNIDASKPINKLFTGLGEFKNEKITDEALMNSLFGTEGKGGQINEIKDTILQHSPQEGPITLNKFRSLLNSDELNGVQSQISKLRDNAYRLNDRTLANKLDKLLSTFNNEMRLAQNAGIATHDPELAKFILDLNKKYQNFSTFRRNYSNKNEFLQGESKQDSALKREIKQYLQYGETHPEADKFIRSLTESPNTELQQVGADLKELKSTADQIHAYNPERDISTSVLEKNKSLLERIKAAQSKDPNLLGGEQTQGINQVLAEKPNVNVQNWLNKILQNKAEIANIKAGTSNPDSIARIKFLQDEIDKTLSNGKVLEDLDELNISDKLRAELLNLRTNREIIDANKTPAQNTVLDDFNQEMAYINPEGRQPKNSMGNPMTKSDVLKNSEESLRSLENPQVNTILDKLVGLHNNQDAFNAELEKVIRAGADKSKLESLGSKRYQLDKFLKELDSEVKQFSAPEVKSRLEDMINAIKAREENLRGVVSLNSLGFVSSVPAYAGNLAGLLKKTTQPVRDVNRGIYQGGKAFLGAEDQYASQNLQGVLGKFQKYKMFDAALKNVQSNVNDFQNMDSVRRAAIINSLMQTPETREAAKQLQQEYMGK